MHRSRLFLLLAALALALPLQAPAWQLKDESGALFRFGGHTQFRGRYYDLDFVRDSPVSERGSLNRHCYYSDLSLEFAITPNENVNVFFEMNKLVFLGQEFRYNTIQTGEEVLPTDFVLTDGTKIPVRLNTDEAWEMHLRQAWMDVKVPGMDLKLKFGRQPFMLGNGIYTNTNIATVFGYQFYTSLDPTSPALRLGSMKYFEGVRENFSTALNANDVDDVDLFFADLSVPVDKSKLGVFATHFRDHSLLDNELTHANLGLTANLALPAGWRLNSEFDYQNGHSKAVVALPEIDWTGYAFMANLAAPPLAGGKLRLSGEFGLGSGDDPNTEDFEGYVGVGPFYPYAWAYEYRFIHWIHNSSKFFTARSAGIAENLAPGLENTTYFKVTSVVTLPHRITYIFSPIWLGLTQQGKTFGYEFDNIVQAPIWNNFSYQFIFAAVVPAQWMKDRGFDDVAYGIRSQLEVTF